MSIASNFVLSPGSILARIIHRITGVAPCQKCNDRIKLMNEQGWWWCWKNMPVITQWLVEEANARGYTISESAATMLFKAAIRESRSSKQSINRSKYAQIHNQEN